MNCDYTLGIACGFRRFQLILVFRGKNHFFLRQWQHFPNIGKNSAQKEVNNRTDLAYEHIWEDFPEVSLHKLKIRRLCVTVLENEIGSWPLEKQRRTMPYIT